MSELWDLVSTEAECPYCGRTDDETSLKVDAFDKRYIVRCLGCEEMFKAMKVVTAVKFCTKKIDPARSESEDQDE